MSLCLNANFEALRGICQMNAHYCTGCVESAKRVSDGMIASRDEKLDALRKEKEQLLLQIDELRATIQAEALRTKMLVTTHQVALKQNTAMLELADHYTGSLWPEEVQRAAKEILKAAREAK